jgi:hypothetical protein
MTKKPTTLLPSLLYTKGDEKLEKEVEEELNLPDPPPEVANAALEENEVKK